MEQEKQVCLLYEGDEWLSADSMVLMGVFSSMESLKINAEELIRQRGDEHLTMAENQDFFDGCDESTQEEEINDVVDDILTELFNYGSTCGWSTNYSYEMVVLDNLDEI